MFFITDTFKTFVGIPVTDFSKDTVLDGIIEINKQEIVSFCNLKEYDEKLNFILLKMCVQQYNRMGSEGTTSESFSGVSQSYIDGFSDDIKQALIKHRKMRHL